MQDESVLAAPPDTPDESAPVVGPAGHVGGLVVVAIILRPSSSDSGTTVNRGLGRYSGNAFDTGRRGPSPHLPATRPGRTAPGSAPLGGNLGTEPGLGRRPTPLGSVRSRPRAGTPPGKECQAP